MSWCALSYDLAGRGGIESATLGPGSLTNEDLDCSPSFTDTVIVHMFISKV